MDEVFPVLRDTFSSLNELGTAVLIAFCVVHFLFQTRGDGNQPESIASGKWLLMSTAAGTGFCLFAFGRSWVALVNHFVPEPYLDEVFHIPQTQSYCAGRYFDWDVKITTPPGLYLAAFLWHRFWKMAECSNASLRSFNLWAISVAVLVFACRRLIEANSTTNYSSNRSPQSFSIYALHTGFNVALFPVLFFFYGLFYTDVLSVSVVLSCYLTHLKRVARDRNTLFQDVQYLVQGFLALLMRQTNVFWVVVYMGGLEAVHVLKRQRPASVAETISSWTILDTVRFYGWRYSVGDIHDPPLNLSWPDDWLFCMLSLGTVAICNAPKLIRQVWPHTTLLGLFVGFVLWNGGVVLGDKLNHVATIHLAQMLYIWPLFTFFSAPLLVPLLWSFARFLTRLRIGQQQNLTMLKPSGAGPPASENASWAFRLAQCIFVLKRYYPLYLLGLILIALAIVKYNTIVHPFTLADNRHYMFYVFRYTILRPGMTRYYLVGTYTLSCYLVWRRLSGPNDNSPTGLFICRPFWSAAHAANRTDPTSVTHPESENELFPPNNKKDSETMPSTSASASTLPPATSTALLWLLTTALSLVTAPLVEPRYFILPWIFFRLLVPAWPAAAAAQAPRAVDNKGPVGRPFLSSSLHFGLVLETAWFLVINLGAAYMFLFRPYLWKSEEGQLLDGGGLQRFMW